MWNKLKALWAVKTMVSEIKGGSMDFKTVAGWVKIIAYVFALLGLVMAYLDPKTVIAITVGISALVKIVEVLAPITPTTIDDEILKAIKEGAAKDGLIK